MTDGLTITTLVENTAGGANLLAEHGLAFWIEVIGRRILFDTGQGMVLQHNAEQLGIDLRTVDVIVISHGHFDHTGGLKQVLGEGIDADLYIHPNAFRPRYAKEKSPPHRAIGMPEIDENYVRARVRRLVPTSQPVEIDGLGIHVTGEIPRHTDFEDVGGPFFLDADCREPDPIVDDQAMFIDTPEGLVVVLGCAHAGVVNTLRHIDDLAGERTIAAVLGGMHLVRASQQRLDATADALKRLDVSQIAPGHCTGLRAMSYLMNRMPDQCVPCTTGSVFHFGQR